MRTSLVKDLQCNRILQNWSLYSCVAVLDLALLVCEALAVPYAVAILRLRDTNRPCYSRSVLSPCGPSWPSRFGGLQHHHPGPLGSGDCWLEASLHPEGPATGQLDQAFPWFSLVPEQMLSWYPNSTLHFMLPMQPSQL
jgi:hypothetical protein